MKTNLTKSITIHSAYGVEVEYENGDIYKVDPTTVSVDGLYTENETLSICNAIMAVEQGKAKLLLHSLDKLTQEIDGKVPALELAELAMSRENIDQTIKNSNSLGFDYKIVQKPFGKMLKITRADTWILLISFSEVDRCKQYIFDYLLANHYNVFGLSSEYVKEKSL